MTSFSGYHGEGDVCSLDEGSISNSKLLSDMFSAFVERNSTKVDNFKIVMNTLLKNEDFLNSFKK